jgi:hypothetical protein
MRWSDDDLRVLKRLQDLTGCSAAAVLRMAIREMLRRIETAEVEAPLARTGT